MHSVWECMPAPRMTTAVIRRVPISDRYRAQCAATGTGRELSNNRLEDALDAITEVLRIEPNHIQARGWRGVVLIALGRSEEALAELDQGIALDPTGRDIAFLLRQKCKAYSYLGQYEKAISVCEKSATDHQFLTPFVYLTADYAQLGEMEEPRSPRTCCWALVPDLPVRAYCRCRRTHHGIPSGRTKLRPMSYPVRVRLGFQKNKEIDTRTAAHCADLEINSVIAWCSQGMV
jgi:tetratricopeptide (TPR) repeat protein